MIAEDASKLLKERGATLAVAESCTGGRLAAAFTRNAGASEYFLGGVVAYSNDVKTSVLGVSADDLARFGAVSRPVAEQMAAGARRITGADFAVSTTGIAGPGGGSAEKPVGTVWIAVASASVSGSCGDGSAGEEACDEGSAGEEARGEGVDASHEEVVANGGNRGEGSDCEEVMTRCFHFEGSREEIMEQSVAAATEMLRERLRGVLQATASCC